MLFLWFTSTCGFIVNQKINSYFSYMTSNDLIVVRFGIPNCLYFFNLLLFEQFQYHARDWTKILICVNISNNIMEATAKSSNHINRIHHSPLLYILYLVVIALWFYWTAFLNKFIERELPFQLVLNYACNPFKK